MPKRTDIKKIVVIGSGPTRIGQAAEFDDTVNQACAVLKEEGYEVVLVHSSPSATMSGNENVDHVYIEPVTSEFVARILRKELADAILPIVGGQTALNVSYELAISGILTELNVELLGIDFSVIRQAQQPSLFKRLINSLALPLPPSQMVNAVDEALDFAQKIGYPVFVKPAFTTAGSASGICHNDLQLRGFIKKGLRLSPKAQCIVEQNLAGFKEIEYEVIRDSTGNALSVANMENFDPVGVHSGDSVVFVPSQTLTDHEHQLLRDASLKIIHALKIEGSCHIRLAIDPSSFNYYVLEVNPRLTRSSVLASKAAGYPMAKIATNVAIGKELSEIKNSITPEISADFEPALDYIVTKIPYWSFKKVKYQLNTQMKSTGEVMAIGRTLEESLLKAVRFLDDSFDFDFLQKQTDDALIQKIVYGENNRLFTLAESLRRGYTIDELAERTKIDLFFLDKIAHIVEIEAQLEENKNDLSILKIAKQNGISDQKIAQLWQIEENDIYQLRQQQQINSVFKMVDTCAGEFAASRPYFYSTFEIENESTATQEPSILILGAGPHKIGQASEFDYLTVQAIKAVQQAGYKAILVNNNPASATTDFSISDKLYFEPLVLEEVRTIIELEQPLAVIAQFGGLTAQNLGQLLESFGVKVLGTNQKPLEQLKAPQTWTDLLKEVVIPSEKKPLAFSESEILAMAQSLSFPLNLRSRDLTNEENLQRVDTMEDLKWKLQYLKRDAQNFPMLVTPFVAGRVCEVEVIYDGHTVFIPGFIEHIEKNDVHSGDSMVVSPPQNFSKKELETIENYASRVVRQLNLQGIINIQFLVTKDQLYINHILPYGSRRVAFLSKVTSLPIAQIASRVILGEKLSDMGYKLTMPSAKNKNMVYVNAPVFSLTNLEAVDGYLNQEMKATGSVMGADISLEKALYKAFSASNLAIPEFGSVLFTIADNDKKAALQLAKSFFEVGFNLIATQGTAAFFAKHGLKVHKIGKLTSKDGQTILEQMENGHIQMIINTRERNRQKVSYDGLTIRRKAVEQGIALFTSLDTVAAILKVIQSRAFSTKEL